MNLMSVNGYHAKIEYDADLDLFRGEIRKSLQVFLDVCKEKSIEPRRNYSGKFNLRIPVELHEKAAIVAEVEGKSLNALAQEALLQRVAA